MPIALLFPGQGSQQPDMRDVVAEAAPDLLARCLELVGEDPFDRAGESTRLAQPAIFCASVAGWMRVEPELRGRDVVATAGHSLGEFGALVAAGALDPMDALELVVLRGRLMEEAGGGTMLALLGTDDATAESLAEKHGLSVANMNAPGQIVLSGPVDAIDAASDAAHAQGMKALELGVAGAFHSPAMAPAVAGFTAALQEAPFREPHTTVISCLTAEPMTDPRRDLADVLTGPVRWSATMRALAALGADEFVDVGPGRVLHKLVKRNLREAHA